MDARLVASRMPGISLYGQPFNTPPFPGYLPYGPAEASAFYSTLPTGENAEAWRAGLTQAAAAAYYDPGFAAHYGYGYGPMGLGDGSRRKNATRETTSTLKAWLNEHRKNPYPTKGEKIMLAIITKMTLTQVSTWFANARRRLKKENKMTWSPRNRCGDDDDDDVMDGDDDNNNNNNLNPKGHSQLRETHTNAEDRSISRSPTPNPSIAGNLISDGSHRVSGFDMPHASSHHPFLSRPEITGSFTIQGPAGGAATLLQTGANNDSKRRSGAEDEEEIDLEIVGDERDKSAFVKRSLSTNILSKEETAQIRGSSPTGGPQIPFVPQHSAFHSAPSNRAPAMLLGGYPTPSRSGSAHSKRSQRDSESPRSHPYSRNAVSSPTSSVTSRSSATSPAKPKIWSIADVATSNDGEKAGKIQEETPITAGVHSASMPAPISANMELFGGRGSVQGLLPHHQPVLNQEAHATIRNWMDGLMQQKMAAAAAAAMSGGQAPPSPFFSGGLLPQHLAAALSPAALAVAASFPRGPDGVRFPHAFAGFAELAAAQRAQMMAQAAGLQSHSGPTVRTSSAPLTPTGANKLPFEVAGRHRLISSSDQKIRSPTAAAAAAPSPLYSDGPIEVSPFQPLNNRTDGNGPGVADADASRENLSQSNESK